MAKTDRDWERWGATEPYYGVLTGERFRLASINDNRAEFFETGTSFVQSILSRLETTFGQISRTRALDFGCGVGRLTQALSLEFDQVVGLDISRSMLANAVVKPNIRYGLSDDELSEACGMFSLVISYIVLQHIDPSRGLRLISRLLSRVEAGGGALIHVSVHPKRNIVARTAALARSHVPGANGLFNLVLRRPLGDPQMRMGNYSLAAVLQLFQREGFEDLLTFTEDHGGVLTVGFIGRKRPSSPT